MKSFQDSDVFVRVEFVQQIVEDAGNSGKSETRVRIYNDLFQGHSRSESAFIDLNFQQFQRVMAVGAFFIHPVY